MNFLRRILGCSTGLVLIAGCGGSTTGGGGAGNTGNGSCTITAGTYTFHLAAEPGGTNCGTIPDETVTLNGNETDNGGSTTSGPSDGGSGCATDVASGTCTFTENCTFSSGGGFSTTDTTTYTLNGDSGSGKEVIVSQSGSTVESSCTYDLTITKS